jgi:NADPH:quinone reductase-like Zn-dependent oxidoreductase
MRAVRAPRTGGPEVMRLEMVADPAAGTGQMVVRVAAAGTLGMFVLVP